MFERLVNNRLFLYQKIKSGDGSNNVTWHQVHRLTDIPDDLLSKCQYPYIFSPDFSMYLDVDRKNHLFSIKDTYTNKKIYDVPELLMNSKHEKYLDVAHRF